MVGAWHGAVQIRPELLLSIRIEKHCFQIPIIARFVGIELDLYADEERRMIDREIGNPDVVEDTDHAVALILQLAGIFAQLGEQ